MMSRFVRLLPITIAAAGLLLAVRVGDIWLGMRVGLSAAEAQVTVADPVEPELEFTYDIDVIPSAGGPDDGRDAGPNGSPGASGGRHPAAAADSQSLFTPEEVEVLQELSARRRELVEHERQLALREGLLNAAEQRIEDRILEMQELRARIESLVSQHNEQEEVELSSVVKIYETMKPKEAARILGELDLEILLPIMERMKERAMAPVLAAMEPAKAREITTELARQQPITFPGGG